MSPPLIRPGQVFAGYTIVRLLGSGGMGEVYLAQHPRLPRREALKVLGKDVSADEDYRRRFIKEAELAAALWHPNIVRINDRGKFNRRLWISMDFVDGTDAASLLRDRYPVGMPADQAATIVAAIASALDYAHERHDVLHRDVNPANILLTKPENGEQRILLGDFGIARNIADPTGLTATNMTVGTFPYAAPEQLTGEPIDGRADQYALAATAYHLLAGTTPFPYTNPAVVISHHLTAPPPALAKTRPKLAGFDPVFAVALAKEPADRFARCTDFANAFSEAGLWRAPTASVSTMQTPVACRPPAGAAAPPARAGTDKRQRRRPRWIFTAASTVLALNLVGALGFATQSSPGAPAPGRPAASPTSSRPQRAQDGATPSASAPQQPAPTPTQPAASAAPPFVAPTPAARPAAPAPRQLAPPPTRAPVPAVAAPAPRSVPAAPHSAPPRSGSNPDQTYLNQISSIPGVTVTDPTEATTTARGVCFGLQNGGTPADEVALSENRSGLTPTQAAAGVKAAISAYCPQYGR